MAVMLAFLAGAVAAGTAAMLTPAMKVEPLRKALVDVVATMFRANEVVLEATVGVRNELTALMEKAKSKPGPHANPTPPPVPPLPLLDAA